MKKDEGGQRRSVSQTLHVVVNQKPLTTATIMKIYGVSRATAKRDMGLLRDMLPPQFQHLVGLGYSDPSARPEKVHDWQGWGAGNVPGLIARAYA